MIKQVVFSAIISLPAAAHAEMEHSNEGEHMRGNAGAACNGIYYESVPGADGDAQGRPNCAVAASKEEALKCNAATGASSMGLTGLGYDTGMIGQVVFQNCWGNPPKP